MFRGKPIKVCKKCSGFNVTELDNVIGKKNYSVGCIGACKKDRNKIYGRINEKIVECDSKEDFLLLAKSTIR